MRSRVLQRDVNTPPCPIASPCSSEGQFYSRRFRNLSPLPETCIGGCQKTCGSRSPSLTVDADNVSERSVYLTPSHLNTDKDLFFEANGHDVEMGRYIAVQNRSFSNDKLSNIKTPFFDLCSVRKISSESNLSTLISRSAAKKSPLEISENQNHSAPNDCAIKFDIKPAQADSSNSVHSEINWRNRGKSKVAPPLLTTNNLAMGSPIVATHHLTIDHRHIGLSSDSVYYDSLSAVGTPCVKSPQDFSALFTDDVRPVPSAMIEEPPFTDVETSSCRPPPLRLDELDFRPSSSSKNSLFSELLSTPHISRTPTPALSESKLSSPFASRTPSPCLFWQNSPREISNSSNHTALAKPTPTRNDCPTNALRLAPSLLPPQVTHLVSSSLPQETRLGFRPAFQDNGLTFALKAKDSCLSFNQETKENCFAFKPTSDKNREYTTSVHDNGLSFSAPIQEFCRTLFSSIEERSHQAKHQSFNLCKDSSLTEHDSLISGADHAECTSTAAVSPRGSRNPTPTRSFSTPSPSFDKTSGSYVLSEESYRANVSRLPRFARRASQGTPVPYGQNQDIMQAKMAGDKNGPLRESSMEVTCAPHSQNLTDSLETDDRTSLV